MLQLCRKKVFNVILKVFNILFNIYFNYSKWYNFIKKKSYKNPVDLVLTCEASTLTAPC